MRKINKMSFISSLFSIKNDLRHKDGLEKLAQSMATMSDNVRRLADGMELLTKILRDHDMLLAEMFALQMHIVRILDSETLEVQAKEKTEKKTEKPN